MRFIECNPNCPRESLVQKFGLRIEGGRKLGNGIEFVNIYKGNEFIMELLK